MIMRSVIKTIIGITKTKQSIVFKIKQELKIYIANNAARVEGGGVQKFCIPQILQRTDHLI